MTDQAPNIDLQPGDKGRLVYDKARRTIVAEHRAHKVMTPEEYEAMPIIGWHEVCRDVDGFGGIGVRFLGETNRRAAATGASSVAEIAAEGAPGGGGDR